MNTNIWIARTAGLQKNVNISAVGRNEEDEKTNESMDRGGARIDGGLPGLGGSWGGCRAAENGEK